MKVVGERGVSTGTPDTASTSTSTGHTSSTSGLWAGLDGSSLMWTNGLVLELKKKNVFIITGSRLLKNFFTNFFFNQISLNDDLFYANKYCDNANFLNK